MSAVATGPTQDDNQEKGNKDEPVNNSATTAGIRSALHKTKSLGASVGAVGANALLGFITGAGRKVGEHVMEKLLDQ